MHRYRSSDSNDSRATFAGGRNGMVMGAIGGALLFAIGSFALDLFGVGNGGPGLNVMAGIVTGGLAGMMIGALHARPGGHAFYHGPERRIEPIAFKGHDRRMHR